MSRGFTKQVPQLVAQHPGLTANELAVLALQEGYGSSARDPEYSLAQTLLKEHREGRLPCVESRRVNGKLRFWPASGDTDGSRRMADAPSPGKPPGSVTVVLPDELQGDVDALVAVGVVPSRGEALLLLASKGSQTWVGLGDVRDGLRQLKDRLVV